MEGNPKLCQSVRAIDPLLALAISRMSHIGAIDAGARSNYRVRDAARDTYVG